MVYVGGFLDKAIIIFVSAVNPFRSHLSKRWQQQQQQPHQRSNVGTNKQRTKSISKRKKGRIATSKMLWLWTNWCWLMWVIWKGDKYSFDHLNIIWTWATPNSKLFWIVNYKVFVFFVARCCVILICVDDVPCVAVFTRGMHAAKADNTIRKIGKIQPRIYHITNHLVWHF